MTQLQTNVSQAVFSNPTGLTVQAITETALVEMLRANKGATAVTIVAKTSQSVTVFKVSRVNGMIGFRYDNAVNRQLAREGQQADFVAKPRKWGRHIEGTPLVEHKGNSYVELKVEKSLGYRFEHFNGTPFTDAETAAWLASHPIKSRPTTQGTEKEIILRDYKVDSIISITYRGVCYLIAR